MHHVALQLAKNEMQHVVEVHADVGGDAKGLAVVALPTFHVPLAARGDVRQLDVELGVGRGGGNFFAKLEDGGVMAQLKNVVDALAGFLFNQGQFIQQLRRGHQGLFTNHVAAQAQPCGNVRVVQVVGAADGDIVKRRAGATLELMGIFVKALKFGKKFALGRNAVNDADGVVDVVGSGQVVAGGLNGLHVTRRNVAGGTNECKVLHK